MIIYLCTKFQSNTPTLSKDIARKPFFKVENFSKSKRAITPIIIGGFYPKSNLNTPILSKDIARTPKVLRTGRMDIRMDSSDTICTPIENGGGITNPRTSVKHLSLRQLNPITSLKLHMQGKKISAHDILK